MEQTRDITRRNRGWLCHSRWCELPGKTRRTGRPLSPGVPDRSARSSQSEQAAKTPRLEREVKLSSHRGHAAVWGKIQGTHAGPWNWQVSAVCVSRVVEGVNEATVWTSFASVVSVDVYLDMGRNHVQLPICLF